MICHARTDGHYPVEGPVARITLHSPDNRNALVDDLLQVVTEATDELAEQSARLFGLEEGATE